MNPNENLIDLPPDLSIHSPEENLSCPECGGEGGRETYNPCSKCEGRGWWHISTGRDCHRCNATGRKLPWFHYIDCPSCGGKGEGYMQRCPDCEGAGKLNLQHHLCGVCDGSKSIGITKLIVRKATPEYISERVSDFEKCSKMSDLLNVERANKMYLMLKEVDQEAEQSRDNELFPIEIRGRIDCAERQMAQSKYQLETMRAVVLKPDEAKMEQDKECRQKIRSLGIQEYDSD